MAPRVFEMPEHKRNEVIFGCLRPWNTDLLSAQLLEQDVFGDGIVLNLSETVQ